MTIDSEVCPSCGTPRAGRYCAACGERFLTPADLELKHWFFTHLPHETLHVDGKFLSTVRALFTRPGATAADYVAGRRRRFLDPLRLYLVVFFLHAFLSSLGNPPATLPEKAARVDPTGTLTALAARRPEVHWHDPVIEQRLATAGHWLSEFGTMVIVLLVAAVQLLLFRKFRRHYLEHLALALNVATFFICVLIVGEALVAVLGHSRMGMQAEVVRDVVVSSVVPIYWFAAIRRFYGTGTLAAVLYAVLMTAADVLIANLLNLLILALMIEAT